VLFDREWTSVDRNAENFNIRHESSPCLTKGKGEQLSDNTEDCNGRISEEEKLVQTLLEKKVQTNVTDDISKTYGDNHRPYDAKHPRAHSTNWESDIVCIGHGRTNFGVR